MNRSLQQADGFSEFPLSESDQRNESLHIRVLGGGLAQVSCVRHQWEIVVPIGLARFACPQCALAEVNHDEQ